MSFGNTGSRTALGSAFNAPRDAGPARNGNGNGQGDDHEGPDDHEPRVYSPELHRALSEVKGQAQFLLYLADQIEESLEQLSTEADPAHGSYLCRMLGMYSAQLETRHQGLGDKIAETCQEVYVTVREHDHLI